MLKQKNKKSMFTTPSHGGKFCLSHKYYQWYKDDISEVDVYNPQEELKIAEQWAADVYGTKYTKFLTNGSTSGIIAAVIASGCKKILIWQEAHPCHKNAAKLSGSEVIEYETEFVKELGVYRALQPEQVEILLNRNNPDGIIITTPTYEGFVCDIREIQKICKKYKVKLIADEAHGALYPFSNNLPESAVKYADYTVQSLHKTAGGINPTALLHSNDNNPDAALSLINTTSPSYPMLATIEKNIRFLNSARGRLKIENLIKNIKNLNFPMQNDDVTKIILKHDRLSGYELSELLYNRYGIEDERTNAKSTMLLTGIGTDLKKLNKLKQAYKKIFMLK